MEQLTAEYIKKQLTYVRTNTTTIQHFAECVNIQYSNDIQSIINFWFGDGQTWNVLNYN